MPSTGVMYTIHMNPSIQSGGLSVESHSDYPNNLASKIKGGLHVFESGG